MAFDKYKACIDLETRQDCPDRCAYPDCHGTCEGYEFRCKESEEKRRKEKESRWVPTDHHVKASLATLKKQKKLTGYKR